MSRFPEKLLAASLLYFGILCPLALSQQSSESKTLVLKGVTVIDGSGGLPTKEAVIVIDGDKIQSVGGKETSYSADATVVDLSGKFIIPGLIESHAHYEEWMGEAMLNHGVTTVMAVGGRYGKRKEASQGSNARIPRIFDTAGGPGLSPSLTQEQVRVSVREWLREKPDFGTLRAFNDRNKQVYQWAAEEIHRAGLILFGHTENAPASIGAGQDVVEHLWGFAEAMMSPKELEEFQEGRYLHWGTFLRDGAERDRMIKDAVDRGVYLNPTFLYEFGSLSPLAAKHELEDYRLYSEPLLMVYYPRNVAESLLQKHKQIRNFSSKYESLVFISRLTPEEAQEFQRAYRLFSDFIKRFVQAGGKIQAGTDTLSGGTPGLSLHQEMELLVEAGLTPMQALESATSWSAHTLAGKDSALGMPKVGAIRAGSFADIVVLGANPLEDITNTRKIERVMKGGKFIDLGYTPAYFTFTRPPRGIDLKTLAPAIVAISPYTVVEGSPDFEMIVEGTGFVGKSVVRVDGVSLPTTFLSTRKLNVKIPANLVEKATPNPFVAPGPEQKVGVFGDRLLPITVFTSPPEGGTSNNVFLRIRAKWMADVK